MKKRVWVLLLVLGLLSLVFSLAACDLLGLGSGGSEGVAPEFKSFEISSTPNSERASTFIYAEAYQDVYFFVELENRGNLVISSVTINGKAYEPTSFESGSDRKTIIIKANVADATGIVSYTLESVKYIDGRVIKDVAIDGEQKVSVGIYEQNAVYATVTEAVGFDEITLKINVKDDGGLIAFSNGAVKVELYCDGKLIEGRGLAVGSNEVTFDNLEMGQWYWYQVVGFYDNLKDGGKYDYMLYTNTFSTKEVVKFSNVNVTYDGVSFDLDWHEDAVGYSVSKLMLETENSEMGLEKTAKSVSNLFSNRDYAIVAYYDHRGKEEQIRLDFHTLEKHAPVFEVANLWVTEDVIRADLNVVDDDNAGSLEVTFNGQTVTPSSQQQISFDKLTYGLTYGQTYEIELIYKYDLNDGAGQHSIEENLSVTIDNQTFHQTSCKMTYRVLPDGTCAVSKNNTCTHSEVHVPSTVDGYVVSALSASAFSQSATLQSVVIPEGVTTIGDSAFYGCSNLENVTIPTSVTEIQSYVFQNCKKLESITLPQNITSISRYAFGSCEKLASIAIPKDVTVIDVGAFYGCSNLQNVTLPSSLVTIGDSAFYGCAAITELVVPASVTSIGNSAYRGTKLNTLTFEEGSRLEAIGDEAFYYLDKITSLSLPDSLKTIGARAFFHINDLATLTIPASVVTVNDEAFSSIWYLRELIFEGENLVTIGASAFEDCFNVAELSIPSSVLTIGNRAFCDWQALKTLTFYGSTKLETIGDQAFANCKELTDVIIPTSVTSIGAKAFYGCAKITWINIPWTVVSIGAEAFSGTSLNTVAFGGENSSLQTIGDKAFYGTDIASLTIPSSVISIGESAFYHCKNLVEVIFESDSHLETIGDSAFANCTEIETLKVPASVTTIGASAFKLCTGLTTVEFEPNSRLTTIGDSAFEGCRLLPSVNIPKSAVTLGDGAFRGCVQLSELAFEAESHLETIGEYAFYECRLIAEVVLPASVKRIQLGAFEGCSGLKSAKFEAGSQLNLLGGNAFYGCSSLQNIILPEGITTIDYSTFQNCSSLEWIVIPSTVTTIQWQTFWGCVKLQTIYFGGSAAQWNRISITGDDIQQITRYYFVGSPGWDFDEDGNPTPV